MNTKIHLGRAGRRFCSLGMILMGGAAILLASPSAHAQAAGAGGGISLNFNNGDIKTVLRNLFQGANKNFTIDPNVAGTVTVDVNGVTFDQALNAVLSGTYPPLQATLSPDGIYTVSYKQATPQVAPTDTGPRGGGPAATTPTPTTEANHFYQPIRINHYDAYYMALLVAQFSPQPSPPVLVPADPPVPQTQSSFGNNNGGFGGNSFGGGGFGGNSFGGGGFGGNNFGGGGFGGGGIGGIGGGGFGGGIL